MTLPKRKIGINVREELRLNTDTSSTSSSRKQNNLAAPKLAKIAPQIPPSSRNPSSKVEQFRVAPQQQEQQQQQQQQQHQQQQQQGPYGVQSPQFTTPSSHASSPTHVKSPSYVFPGVMAPAGLEPQPQMVQQPRGFEQTMNDSKAMLAAQMARRAQTAYYPNPSPFQKHYDQLGINYCPSISCFIINAYTRQTRNTVHNQT